MFVTPLVLDSSLSNFPSLFAESLVIYKGKTGTDLLTHPLFAKFNDCDSAEKVIAIFDVTCNAFGDFQKKKAFKWIEPMVHVLMSVTGALGDGTAVVSACLFVRYFALISISC
jgi:hypothetical protein